MNFELIDNSLQIVLLAGSSLASIAAAIRHKERLLLILALFYLCFSMGTLYWVLHLFIIGTVPQVFYVAEFSWIAAYLFLLSYQLLRTGSMWPLFSLPALLYSLFTIAVMLRLYVFGPSRLVSAAFAAVLSVITYLAIRHLQCKGSPRLIDGWILLCLTLQILLYVASAFMHDFTRFNLYFAIDMALSIFLTALLPLTLREVTRT